MSHAKNQSGTDGHPALDERRGEPAEIIKTPLRPLDKCRSCGENVLIVSSDLKENVDQTTGTKLYEVVAVRNEPCGCTFAVGERTLRDE